MVRSRMRHPGTPYNGRSDAELCAWMAQGIMGWYPSTHRVKSGARPKVWREADGHIAAFISSDDRGWRPTHDVTDAFEAVDKWREDGGKPVGRPYRRYGLRMDLGIHVAYLSWPNAGTGKEDRVYARAETRELAICRAFWTMGELLELRETQV